jgi:hypothetical protein
MTATEQWHKADSASRAEQFAWYSWECAGILDIISSQHMYFAYMLASYDRCFYCAFVKRVFCTTKDSLSFSNNRPIVSSDHWTVQFRSLQDLNQNLLSWYSPLPISFQKTNQTPPLPSSPPLSSPFHNLQLTHPLHKDLIFHLMTLDG